MSGGITQQSLIKVDEERQLVYAPVYIPGVVDSQGEWASAESIEKAAHEFLASGAVNAIDTNHDLENNGSVVAESFITRKGDPDFPIEGSWVLGIRVPDSIWEDVKKGDLNGYSMYGSAVRNEGTVEIEIPDTGILNGYTHLTEGHTHDFVVKFDTQTGAFLGGETSPGEDGHVHKIAAGVVTEKSGTDNHTHRFSLIS